MTRFSNILPLTALLVSIFALAGQAGAQQTAPRQSYKDAMGWYRAQAESGDPKAQFYYAVRLEQGEAKRRDPAAALKWFKRAAEGGYPLAQYKLGLIAQFGTAAMAADLAEARDWYRRAADLGVVEAAYNLATMLAGGVGGDQDDLQALTLFRTAARGGIAAAFLNMATISARGPGGGAADVIEALKWAQLANRAKVAEAPGFVEALQAGMTVDQIAEATMRAAAWK